MSIKTKKQFEKSSIKPNNNIDRNFSMKANDMCMNITYNFNYFLTGGYSLETIKNYIALISNKKNYIDSLRYARNNELKWYNLCCESYTEILKQFGKLDESDYEIDEFGNMKIKTKDFFKAL